MTRSGASGTGRRRTGSALSPGWLSLPVSEDGFDDETIAAVAAEHDVAPAALRAALRDHQSLVREHRGVGGVDGLVYEWRTSFREDPLLGRDGAAYLLAVEERVWADFAERMDCPAATLAAVRAVHARHVAARVGDEGDRPPSVTDREPMVLVPAP